MERNDKVRPKKYLGQHFLKDQNIARKIVDALIFDDNKRVLEIGPGMGVLTQYLLLIKDIELKVVEIDKESVEYLKNNFSLLQSDIIEGDFLQLDLSTIYAGTYAIIGNFPYNISSQIFFSILEHKNTINQVVCMLQKEVADRIASPHGSKTYGILSVLLQAYYDIDSCFKVPPGVFNPPPKVMSAVIRLRRNTLKSLPCDERLFVQVVKQGFNNRRKTLRNALKNLNLEADVSALALLDKRAEQLSVADFISLTKIIEDSRAGTNN
ncbi:16S rRNA (adenine(1518)-N(6)/adenine(1519)-N(6))-dimethyltransferase RsmA [Chryseosolibacter indicus]|uniref:Ribosomal RNA small subunit methyltransferase A n=1 Tax=Chryseosolibacter indicus TaxID=2782351 RepID=A0ABS5VLK3_9BACT|nr:16S rRNA (adenine(1518)-N(6)/adenine(1519)-N(6))-dimethyltransferase RsmA [Chryseosolibacter indicus]MBT1702333.1 16S rRNA (adenine(1518)-N(6)/adenine(1519)-N(6))-dimethyltransferase RsmA [Chryseosolibacter indicus]